MDAVLRDKPLAEENVPVGRVQHAEEGLGVLRQPGIQPAGRRAQERRMTSRTSFRRIDTQDPKGRHHWESRHAPELLVRRRVHEVGAVLAPKGETLRVDADAEVRSVHLLLHDQDAPGAEEEPRVVERHH